ncbi:MAG: DUF2203 domain-containing protein [Planctomycetes bacterium]|nr:DUF2203 domain-containing protein [Planctomycetota bacterium]
MKVFTPFEANRTLPLVRQIVRDVLERGQELKRIHERADPADRSRLEDLVEDLNDLFTELESIGCSFRAPDFEIGLVDFPGLIDGEPVHLCWRSDEESLAFYHPPEAGFAGRQRIPPELLEAPASEPNS